MSFYTGFNAVASVICLYLILNDAELAAKIAPFSVLETLALFGFATCVWDAMRGAVMDLRKS